tara:strand:- start:182 stop:433 length:252 start_codon:yes stop_codon:yes gene_type:complete
MGLQWIWGDKKDPPLKLEYKSKNKDKTLIKSKVKVHLVLDLESPISDDIMQTIRESKVDFLLPPDTNLHGVELTMVEYLGRGG